MKLLKIFAAGIATVALSATAQAQDSDYGYANIGGTLLSSGGVDLTAIDAKLGYAFTEYLGAEVEGAIGIGDDDGIELDSHLAAFMVARLPAGDNFDLFVRGGYFTASISGDGGGVDADGFGIGGGGQYFLTDNDGIRLEYTYLDDDGSADQFTLSYVRKF